MGNFYIHLRLKEKISLLGAGSVLITVISLVALAVWQSGQYNMLAQREVSSLIETNLDSITRGVYHLIKTEHEATQQQIDSNLNVARRVLASRGGISLSDERVTWTATNQFNRQQSRITLPQMMVGGRWLGMNTDPDSETAVVDEVTRLVKDTATIFQVMNDQGDMIRVATTVRNSKGKRAIGTYIPAVNPDGSPNPVVTAVKQGKTYHGRAFVVDEWYLTAYEPITDRSGKLLGMLYVGVKLRNVENRVRAAILQTMVGKTGYVYVLGGKGEHQGHYVISKQGKRDGEHILENTDSKGSYVIKSIIDKAIVLGPGDLGTERYLWQNPGEPEPRWKVARLAYYEPLDWIIGTSVYEDELQLYRTVLQDGRIKMTSIMSIAGLLLSIAIGMFGMVVVRTLVRPVQELKGAVETIIQGDLDRIVDVQSPDEIGELAQSFNIMTSRLRSTMEGLHKLNRTLRVLSECNQSLIRATNEMTLLQDVLGIMVELGNYRMAWVGFAEKDAAKSVRPVACAGHDDGYLDDVAITWDESDLGGGPTGLAIRKREIVFVEDIQTDESYIPWRDRALQRNFRSSIAIPIKTNDDVLGALVLYADTPGAFESEEVKLLQELADDLAYGILALRTGKERTRAEKALQQAERKYRGIFENAIEGIFQTSVGGRFISANPAMATMLGYASPADLMETITDLGSQIYVDAGCRAEFKRKMDTDGEVNCFECQVYRKDGGQIWLSLTGRTVSYDDAMVYYEGVAEDITKRKQSEEELRELNIALEQRVAQRTAELEQANKQLESFSYSVSHDLRAPLRAIDGFSSILVSEFSEGIPEDAQRYLKRIAGNVRRMEGLIDDLLTFSRLGRMPLSKMIIEPAVLVNGVLEELDNERAGRQIEVIVGDLPSCEADPKLLKQVFFNLLSNAFKYTRRREDARIEVGAYLQDARYVYFVRDNGAGFDMQYADKLFSVFQRLHPQEMFEGTGVGLAIVSNIINRHGGSIWAEGEVDRGATFYFTL